MLGVLETILPVFLVITLGNLFRRFGFLDMDFWKGLDKLSYWVLFPVLLFYFTYHAPFDTLTVGPMIKAYMGAIIVTGLLCILLRPATRMRISGETFGSIFQGAVRQSTYIGFTIALLVGGQDGFLRSTILTAATVPFLNILCVSVILLTLSREEKLSLGAISLKLLKGLATNPLIIAVGSGLILNRLHIPIPDIALGTMDILKQAALSASLLCVGASLRIKSIPKAGLEVLMASSLKFVIMPLVAFGLCLYLEMDPLSATIVLIFSSLPTAPAAFNLARQLGGDSDSMAVIITVQTILSILTLSLILYVTSVTFPSV